MTLQLPNYSIKKPYEVVEDVLMRVDKFVFLVDFVILDYEQDMHYPLILGRPFLNTGRALIDVHEGKITLRVRDEQVEFTMSKLMKQPIYEEESCMRVEVVDDFVREVHEMMEFNKCTEGMQLDEEV